MAGTFQRIWTSDTAFGGNSYSATSDGVTVHLRRGPFRDRGHTTIAKVNAGEWRDMLDQNGQPCFSEIERIAATLPSCQS
jgi:hypothetical protein